MALPGNDSRTVLSGGGYIKFDSRGTVTDTQGLVGAHPGCFGSVLVCADQTSITGFVLATEPKPTGLRVAKIVALTSVQDWPRFAIPC
ncbi:MAG TPA: hypothetical protein VE684_15605 [Crenalkalicoccus sp.]|jgi:hypothetical protein|nr:hypothetical protein [Crenalkalicoccus sp.]